MSKIEQGPVTCVCRDGLATITMDDGKANVINSESLRGMDAALTCARESDVEAVVLTGRQELFCAGLDLKTLPTLSRSDLQDFVRQFANVLRDLVSFERPIVAACHGHAIAGGAVLLLTCDHVVAAHGDYNVGLNEVAIGIPMPTFIMELAKTKLATPSHFLAILHGKLFSPEEARRIGYIDEVTESSAVTTRATTVARKLGSLPPMAFSQTKRRLWDKWLDLSTDQLVDELAIQLPAFD